MTLNNEPDSSAILQITPAHYQYTLAPGSSTEIPVRVRNLGAEGDYFELGVRGIPASWVSISPQVIYLGAGEEQEFTLVLQTPPPPQTQPGVYTMVVVASLQADPRQNAAVEITLQVAAFESQGRIGVLLESVNFAVSPGSSVPVKIYLVNQGLTADTFRLGIEGIPVNWVSTQRPQARLDPGERTELRLDIYPPQAPQSKAGRHPFIIWVESQQAPEDRKEVDCILTIAVHTQFRSRIEPEQTPAGTPARVLVENQSNIDQNFVISWQSVQGDLDFELLLPPPETTRPGARPTPQVRPLRESFPLRVAAGEIGWVAFQARPTRRVLLGGRHLHDYRVTVIPADEPPTEGQSIKGQVASSAWLPAWLVPAFLIVCIGLTCLAALIFNTSRLQTARATQTVLAGTTMVAAATETSAANQTAAALAGEQDQDGDGLTDRVEGELGTNPGNPDSDGDELPDGEEVNTRGTNPLNADSDGDGLSDGDEALRRSTDPLNPDTDGDSLPDMQEVSRGTDPLNPDSDADGLPDGEEVTIGTDPLNPDTDNDQLLDGEENVTCPNPLDPDSDDDGLIDGQDLDPCEVNNPSLTATAVAGLPTETLVPTSMPTGIAPTLTPTLPGTPEDTPIPPPIPGVLAFQSNREGNPEIYLYNAGDASLTRLTNSASVDSQPSFSPDGSRVAFTSNRDGNNEIYLVNVDGSGLQNLSNDPADDQFPVWSPDGQWIAFSTNRDGNWEVYVVRADGSELRNLTNNAADDWYPGWYRSGLLIVTTEQIVFASNREGNFDIFTMNPDGTALTNLTNNPAEDNYPAVAYTQNEIAFVSNRDGQPEIYSMPASGGQATNLSNHPAEDLYPAWSPDGAWLAYVSNRDGNREIYVVDNAGSSTRNLTENSAEENFPAWK